MKNIPDARVGLGLLSDIRTFEDGDLLEFTGSVGQDERGPITHGPGGAVVTPPCERCGTRCGRDGDGLELPHVVPCGRPCELTAGSDEHDTCAGRCATCRRIITGCGGIDAPCGREGCPECAVHATDERSDILCGRAPPITRCAWTWDRVTCRYCLALRPQEVLRAGDSP